MACYERQILVPYLRDVCSVEMLCAKLKREISESESRIRSLTTSTKREVKEPVKPKKEDYRTPKKEGWLGFLVFGMIPFIIAYQEATSGHAEKISIAVFIMLGVILVGIGVLRWFSAGLVEGDDERRYNHAMSEYRAQLKANESLKNDISRSYEMMKSEQQYLPILQQRLSAAENMRDEVYSVNVIPSRYRSIHVAYYLYDYFDSCRETDLDKIIQTMLLDEIVQRLDKIIVQNEEILLNQRVQIALQEESNRMAAEHHRQTMQQLARMEQNQELQMDYQNMIARNQEVTNFFLAADYLKNL